jgi:hypothetical protein
LDFGLFVKYTYLLAYCGIDNGYFRLDVHEIDELRTMNYCRVLYFILPRWTIIFHMSCTFRAWGQPIQAFGSGS